MFIKIQAKATIFICCTGRTLSYSNLHWPYSYYALKRFIKKLLFSKKAYVQVDHSESAVFAVPVL